MFKERRNLDATKSKVNAWCTKRQAKSSQVALAVAVLGDKSSVSTRQKVRTLTALFSDISAFVGIFNQVHLLSIRSFINNKTAIQEALSTNFDQLGFLASLRQFALSRLIDMHLRLPHLIGRLTYHARGQNPTRKSWRA